MKTRGTIPLLFATAFIALKAFAASPAGYTLQSFQSHDGLPQNSVTAIVQTRDGYLWLGTPGGLARFDGVRFKVFDNSFLANIRITALSEAEDGTLWIGHEKGGVSRYKNGQFETLKSAPRHDSVVAIDGDRILLSSGALRDSGGNLFEPDASLEQPPGSLTLAREASGKLWIARAGAVSLLEDNQLKPLEFDRFSANNFVYGIGPARAGGMWVVSNDRVRRWHENKWAEDRGAILWKPALVTALRELKNGALAVGTIDQGLFLLRGNEAPIRFNRSNGLPQDWIRALAEDHEGNLWAGAGSGGLVAIRPARAVTLAPPDNWQGRSVLSVAIGGNGAFWIGTEGAGLYRLDNGRWKHFTDAEGLLNPFIWSLSDNGQGRMWAGAWGSGLLLQNGERFERAPGLESINDPMPALFFPRASGPLWIGTPGGLLRYERGESTLLARELLNPDVRCITEDSRGAIWFGMNGGGLGRHENGAAKQFLRTDGLSSDFVQCLLADDDGSLWIGTSDAGLNRFKDGKFSAVNASHGLPNNVICHIADDRRGYFWISSHGGIMRVDKTQLRECADKKIQRVTCLVYGVTDGLPSLQSSGGLQPAGVRTGDGRLWFATIKGVVGVDPANVWTNLLAPNVLIEEMRVNGGAIGGNTIIPPGRRGFDFDFTALSFAAPERVQFKYRLEGLEPDWIGPVTKRSVSYSYLPHGEYRFHVIASNNDGVWNDRGASLAFTVVPYFWQTVSFRIFATLLLAAIAGLTTWAIVRQRFRRRLELAERQQSIERERARIAQDIHDDLGSSLTRITLLSDSAREDIDKPELAAKDLDRIYETARNLTRSLDEIVWAVNPRHDTLDSLATYLGKFAQDFLGAANIRVRLDIPTDLPQWPLTAEARHNVFLAFKEALNNTVKHARATEVKITLSLQQRSFTLAIEDNGQGFDPAAPRQDITDTEDGLANMKKRLTDIHGSATLKSTPGHGTTISFQVPVSQP